MIIYNLCYVIYSIRDTTLNNLSNEKWNILMFCWGQILYNDSKLRSYVKQIYDEFNLNVSPALKKGKNISLRGFKWFLFKCYSSLFICIVNIPVALLGWLIKWISVAVEAANFSIWVAFWWKAAKTTLHFCASSP